MNACEDKRPAGDLPWFLLILLPVVYAAFAMKPLLVVDETRYLAVAWEMWRDASFLVPQLNDAPYSHKPPFLFWLMHLGWSVFGVVEWWPRLLGPLALALDALLCARLARRLWPDRPQVAPLAGILFVGTLFPVLFSTGVMFDLWATLWVLLGLTALVDAHHGRRLRATVPLASLALGLGILTKGPVLLLYLLPPALAAFHWSRPADGHPRRVLQTGLLGLLGGALLALAWAIPAALDGGAAYREAIFWGQTAGRIEDSFDHARPFWWYLPLLPVMLYPWVWLGEAYHGWRSAPTPRGPGLRLLAWSTLPQFLVFSSISGKQPHYLLPMMPLLAAFLASHLSGRPWLSGRSLFLPFAWAAVFGLALLTAPAWMGPELDPAWLSTSAMAWSGGLLLLLLGFFAWRARLAEQRLLMLACLSPALTLSVLLALGPDFRDSYDIGPAAARVSDWQAEGLEVGFHGMEYAGQFHFLGRLEEPIGNPESRREFKRWLREHPDGTLLLVVRRDEPPPYGETRTPPMAFGSRLLQTWTVPDLRAAMAEGQDSK